MGVINYNIEEGRRDNQREGVSFLGEEKLGKEEGESTHTHYLSSYSNLFQRANSKEVTSCLFLALVMQMVSLFLNMLCYMLCGKS